MSKPSGLTTVLAALLLAAFAAAPSAAQEDRSVRQASADPAGDAPSSLPGIFGEVLDVRVINLEVQVTDKRGTPILGLGPDDFTLLVDGTEVPIDYFSEIRGGVAVSAPSSATAKGLPGVPALAPGEPAGTSYLVFIDDFFSLPGDRDAVLKSLKDDLAYLKPEDRMAIVAYDGEGLEMLSTWSSLQAPLKRAFDQAMFRPAKGLQRLVERRRYEFLSLDRLFFGSIDGDRTAFGSPSRSDLTPDERIYVSEVTEQINRSIAAASATLRSFAKPPGRKVMILLSGGWPFVPAEFLVSDTSRVLFERGGPYGDNLYRRLVETANLLGYTIYPVDVPGLDRNLLDRPGAEIAGAPDPAAIGSRGFLREAEVHQTLRYLARETGGQALIDGRRLEALERVANDVDSYYWLGYTPQRERDDVSHEVEVKLANPDFVSRARGSYLDSSRSREVSMAVESTLLFGNAAAAGSVGVELGAPVSKPKRKMEVPITVSIPVDELTVLPVGSGFGSQVELRIAVQDDKGQQAPIPVIPLNLTYSERPPAGAFGTFATKLLLRRRPHEIVVAVHDPASGRILTTGAEIVPGEE